MELLSSFVTKLENTDDSETPKLRISEDENEEDEDTGDTSW